MDAVVRHSKIDSVTFGYALAGDLITVFLSIPEKNAGVWSQKIPIAPGAFLHPNGIYSTSYSGDPKADIPAGTYIGFEDLAFQSPDSDWDYNDSAYVFPNLTVATED